ncbi:hypothetical protein KKA00_08245 [bacterium]|nr:hypothetical protein [bacterium]MBU1652196.1 hypothetical protein [bacterium]
MTLDPFEHSDNYRDMIEVKLEQVLQEYPAAVISKVIRKVIENLVITERVAEAKGFQITDQDKRNLIERDYEDIQAEVDRAMGGMLGSIISREGG